MRTLLKNTFFAKVDKLGFGFKISKKQNLPYKNSYILKAGYYRLVIFI